MRDVDLFARLLALDRPWSVERVELDERAKRIEVWLHHRSNARFRCPKCAAILPIYDHVPRRWRHLDHGSWTTFLRARVPRVHCVLHGIRQVRLPWALPRGRFTIAFERHAIDTLLEADVLGASRLLRLSWHQSWGVMERAVERGMRAKRRRVIPHLGVDEKAIAKRHHYVTLVSDLDRGTVEFVAFDRKKSSLDAYYQSLSSEQLAGIQALAMDMWEPFITSTHEHVSDAANKIVFDRFHIPPRRLCRVVRGTEEHESEDGTGLGNQGELAELLDLPASRLGRAALEIVVPLGDALGTAAGGQSSEIDPQSPGERADLLRAPDHQRRQRGTKLENPDGQKNAFGFRNREHMRIAIYFHCGGLRLYPR
jgi:transposase